MTRKYTKGVKKEESHSVNEAKNGKKKRVLVNMSKYPDLYDKLIKLSHMNIRSVEQQALYYIMQAVGETEVEVKENDECE